MSRHLPPRPLAPVPGLSLLLGCGSTPQRSSRLAAGGPQVLGGATPSLVRR